MHGSAYEYVARAEAQHGPFRRVCEIGSRNINGSVRPVFDGCHYVGVDIQPGPDVDVVADAADWDTAERFDCVVSTSVLEHTPEAPALVASAARLLEPGGMFVMTCAGVGWAPHSAVDGGALRPGEYYENVTEEMLNNWLSAAGFATWQTDYYPEFADMCCVAWVP